MSIQCKSYISKKTGATTYKYYASVWDSKNGKLITGPYRDYTGAKPTDIKKPPKPLEKQLKLDEAAIIEAISQNTVKKKKAGTHFGEIAILWLDSCKPPVYSHSTWDTYSTFYKRYIKPVFGDRPINKITSVHIQKYVNIIKEEHSEETVNKCITILTDVFNFAIEPLKEIISNPTTGIKRMKVPKKKRPIWSDEEIKYFLSLSDVKSSDYYAMLCISLILGARPSEVCGLSEDSLSDTPKRLYFDRGYDRQGNISDMKTNGSHREILLPDVLYSAVHRRYLWKKEQQLSDSEFADNDFLFVSEFGNPINPSTYSKAFKRLLRNHNDTMDLIEKKKKELPKGERRLPDITLYGCRHSFATNALADQHDPALISSIMGNSVKTLLTFYAHPDQERQLSLINDLADKNMKNTYQNIS